MNEKDKFVLTLNQADFKELKKLQKDMNLDSETCVFRRAFKILHFANKGKSDDGTINVNGKEIKL